MKALFALLTLSVACLAFAGCESQQSTATTPGNDAEPTTIERHTTTIEETRSDPVIIVE